MYRKGFPIWLLAVLGCLNFVLVNCSGDERVVESTEVEPVPSFTPQEITSFDHVGEVYFSFLGINSFATSGGDFILPVWDPALLLKIDSEGKKVIAQTTQGRGPGEITDIGIPKQGNGAVYVFDFNQHKGLIFDEDKLQLIDEFNIDNVKGYYVSRTHPPFKNGEIVVEARNTGWRRNEKSGTILIKYNLKTETYGDSVKLNARRYIPLGDLIGSGYGSAIQLPFGDDQYIEYKDESKTMLLFDSSTDVIAEVDENFDTLKAIKIDLPIERLTEAEKDTFRVKEDFSTKDWRSVEPELPKFKAVVSAVKYHNNEIWLKSNLRGTNDVWFIVNMEGKITKKVRLPKDSYLTHISEWHLGVRLNDYTFALYEYPKESKH